MTDTIDRTGPLVDTGYGWPRYPYETEYAYPEPNPFEVRTPEEIAADTWADNTEWLLWTVAPVHLLPWSHPLAGDFAQARIELRDEVHAIVMGGLAPSELHAKRLARRFFDWERRFMFRMDEQRAAYLAQCVLSGWAATHG